MGYVLTDQHVWKEIGPQVVILHYDTGAYWTLNETASFMWKSLIQGLSAEETANRVAETFDIDGETAHADAQDFIKICISKKILVSS